MFQPEILYRSGNHRHDLKNNIDKKLTVTESSHLFPQKIVWRCDSFYLFGESAGIINWIVSP